MNNIDLEEIIKILPKLIKENDIIKGVIISALSGVVATPEDIIALTKEMDKRFEAMDSKMDRNYNNLKSILSNIQSTIGKPFE